MYVIARHEHCKSKECPAIINVAKLVIRRNVMVMVMVMYP